MSILHGQLLDAAGADRGCDIAMAYPGMENFCHRPRHQSRATSVWTENGFKSIEYFFYQNLSNLSSRNLFAAHGDGVHIATEMYGK